MSDHIIGAHDECVPWCPACGPACEHGANSYECAACAEPDVSAEPSDWPAKARAVCQSAVHLNADFDLYGYGCSQCAAIAAALDEAAARPPAEHPAIAALREPLADNAGALQLLIELARERGHFSADPGGCEYCHAVAYAERAITALIAPSGQERDDGD